MLKQRFCMFFISLSLGTSTIASSEENDLDREAAGDSGFSDGKYITSNGSIKYFYCILFNMLGFDFWVDETSLFLGMATPPTSNCDDVSQDSSGAFSFNQNTNLSTNISNLKNSTENNTPYANGNSAPYQGKTFSFPFSNITIV